MSTHSPRALTATEIIDLLHEARARTLFLLSGVEDEDLLKQHDPLMSPIIWDLGHIGHFEEVWLLKNAASGTHGSEGLEGIYNPFENPRAGRDALPLPRRAEAEGYLAEIRARVPGALGGMDLRDSKQPLLRDGFVFRMVLQHEYQHNETILQTLQLKQGKPYDAPRAWGFGRPEPGSAPPIGSMVRFQGGEVSIGTDDRSEAYDNERPFHSRILPPFWIDATPVTNGQYLEFMEDGGYERTELWSEPGRAWLEAEQAVSPKYWSPDGTDGWSCRIMDRTVPVPRDHPVMHVCYHEAEAFARWAGKRLPTEFEWEAAATWDPIEGRARPFPWGEQAPGPELANLDQLGFGTAPVGAHPENVSPLGCYGMIGDVWEWTSTDFDGYPGYSTFPYPEYSEVFFGDEYKVLRGGSWATRPGAIRSTFRNWDYPIRRQIFSGFRCARDG
jgi:iron(II)-dependent oxidoreductase